MSLPVWPSAFIRLAVAMCSGVVHLPRPTELGAVGVGCLTLEGSALLTLLALAKQVSFLNIWDPHKPVHSPRNSPGQRVRYPSVTGESEFPWI
jgi:hypothetical protein